MTDNNDTTPAADLYWDRAEYLKAVAAPEYRESPRYRAEVAERLQRSMAAGRITSMGEHIRPGQRGHERTAYSEGDGQTGYTVPAADPTWAEAIKVGQGYFKNEVEIANAMAAPAFEIDQTYQRALREKVQRSIREGLIGTDFRAIDPAQRGR
jgi:hypothetical protein